MSRDALRAESPLERRKRVSEEAWANAADFNRWMATCLIRDGRSIAALLAEQEGRDG